MGCAYKAGSSRIIEVVEYVRRPSKKGGVVVMDTPGYDVASITGMVAGGAQVVAFTTGRGTPTGYPIAPLVWEGEHTGGKDGEEDNPSQVARQGEGLLHSGVPPAGGPGRRSGAPR